MLVLSIYFFMHLSFLGDNFTCILVGLHSCNTVCLFQVCSDMYLAMEDVSNYVNFRGSLISRVSCICKNISTKILDTRFRALSVDGNYLEAKLLNVGYL